MPRIGSQGSGVPLDLIPSRSCADIDAADMFKRSYGFGEGMCTCARCLRKGGPMKDDVRETAEKIAAALAGVLYNEVNCDDTVKPHHRATAHEFIEAMEAGDVQRLERLLEDYPDEDSDVATEMIIMAAQLGNVEVIRLLAEHGANVEEPDEQRQGTPLMYATNNGHTTAVKALLDLGADTEAQDIHGYTALIIAMFCDRSSSAEALLRARANIDYADSKGRTALSYAAMYGSTDCIYLLANFGADVFHADGNGYDPLQLAEESGREKAVEAMRKVQMKIRMQERRQKKAGKGHGHLPGKANSMELDQAQLMQKQAEADMMAARLLEELEIEANKKSEAQNKKQKKKGRSKPAGSSSATGDVEHDQASTSSSSHAQYQGTGSTTNIHTSSSNEAAVATTSASTRFWMDELQGGTQAASQAGPSTAGTSMAGPSTGTAPSGTAQQSTTPFASAQQAGPLAPPAPDATADPMPQTSGSDVSAGGEAAANPEALRKEWEELLELAAKCMDEQQQPVLLAQVQSLLPACAAAGISVKYGRKVLQRLEAVGPARDLLRAALAAEPPSRTDLDEALKAAKSVKSLLDGQLITRAEARLEEARVYEEQQRWTALQTQLQGFDAAPSSATTTHASAVDNATAPAGAAADADAQDDEHECVVCFSEFKSVCCIPCGHVCMCLACAEHVQKVRGDCPVCRTPMELFFEIEE